MVKVRNSALNLSVALAPHPSEQDTAGRDKSGSCVNWVKVKNPAYERR